MAPRLAGRIGSPIVMNAVDANLEGGSLRVTANAYGGDTHAVLEVAGDATTILSVSTTAVRAEPAPTATSPSIEDLAWAPSGAAEGVRVIEQAQAKGPRLEDAEVSGNLRRPRGSAPPSTFRSSRRWPKLSEAWPAHRPLVDDGWVEASRQVGLTGRITRPALYVAVGISGASQHMAGCSAAKTIVAINSDRDAAIFKHARYGIVGDCREVLPALIQAAVPGADFPQPGDPGPKQTGGRQGG